MNAPQFRNPVRQRPTHTTWPATRQQATAPTPPRPDPHREERREEEHAGEEPGYGHGV